MLLCSTFWSLDRNAISSRFSLIEASRYSARGTSAPIPTITLIVLLLAIPATSQPQSSLWEWSTRSPGCISLNTTTKECYPVDFPGWGAFMNSYAVWVGNYSNGPNQSYTGQYLYMSWSVTFPSNASCSFFDAVDNSIRVYIGSTLIDNSRSPFASPSCANTFGQWQPLPTMLTNGSQTISIAVLNFFEGSTSDDWASNPAGGALTIQCTDMLLASSLAMGSWNWSTRSPGCIPLNGSTSCYPVTFDNAWCTFMNTYAVWVGNYTNGNNGTLNGQWYYMSWNVTFPLLASCTLYTGVDNQLQIYIGSTTNGSLGGGSASFSCATSQAIPAYLTTGPQVITVGVLNDVATSNWESNPAGAAALIICNYTSSTAMGLTVTSAPSASGASPSLFIIVISIVIAVAILLIAFALMLRRRRHKATHQNPSQQRHDLGSIVSNPLFLYSPSKVVSISQSFSAISVKESDVGANADDSSEPRGFDSGHFINDGGYAIHSTFPTIGSVYSMPNSVTAVLPAYSTRSKHGGWPLYIQDQSAAEYHQPNTRTQSFYSIPTDETSPSYSSVSTVDNSLYG